MNKVALLPIAILPLIFGCQTNPHEALIHKLETSPGAVDHAALAEQYEEEAAEEKQDLEKHKKFLAHYKEHSYLYGRQLDELIEQNESLIAADEKDIAANLKLAQMHRALAGKK